MKCTRCNNLMNDAFTNFTVAKGHDVYLVENVPCLECPTCEHISFRQKVAKTLERYSSGRAMPSAVGKTWVYKWQDAVVEIPREDTVKSTINTPVKVAVSGTFRDYK